MRSSPTLEMAGKPSAETRLHGAGFQEHLTVCGLFQNERPWNMWKHVQCIAKELPAEVLHANATLTTLVVNPSLN